MNDTRREALLADSLVAAAAAVKRYESRRRTASKFLVASVLLVVFVFGLRSRNQSSTVYVIRGDSSGVVLTGPDVARRSESTPTRPARKGDRT